MIQKDLEIFSKHLERLKSVPITEKTVMPVSYSKKGWILSSVSQKQLETEYYQNPVLHAIVNIKASLESNARVNIRNIKTGEIITVEKYRQGKTKDAIVNKMFRLINNPNPLQSRKEFFALNSIFKDVFGNAFIYANSGGKTNLKDVEYLWNVWPQYMKPKTTGKYFDQIGIDGILEKWIWSWNGYDKKFSPEEILHRKEANLTLKTNDDLVLGQSRQASLQYPLDNIRIAYESRNEIAENKGFLGIISSNNTDGNLGSMVMEPEERDEVHNELSEYGLRKGQKKYLVTRHNIKWQQIDQDVRKLGLLNEIVSDTKIVAHEYGLHPLMVQMEQRGATFENQKIAERSTYQNTTIPEFEDKIEDVNVWLKTRDYDWEYVSSFKHIPAAQTDEKERSETVKNLTSAYKELFFAGGCVYNRWLQAIGEEQTKESWGNKRITEMTFDEIQKIKGNFSIQNSLDKANIE